MSANLSHLPKPSQTTNSQAKPLIDYHPINFPEYDHKLMRGQNAYNKLICLVASRALTGTQWAQLDYVLDKQDTYALQQHFEHLKLHQSYLEQRLEELNTEKWYRGEEKDKLQRLEGQMQRLRDSNNQLKLKVKELEDRNRFLGRENGGLNAEKQMLQYVEVNHIKQINNLSHALPQSYLTALKDANKNLIEKFPSKEQLDSTLENFTKTITNLVQEENGRSLKLVETLQKELTELREQKKALEARNEELNRQKDLYKAKYELEARNNHELIEQINRQKRQIQILQITGPN
jgi:DNA repair exonuclease SbcCD ATPase subunit